MPFNQQPTNNSPTTTITKTTFNELAENDQYLKERADLVDSHLTETGIKTDNIKEITAGNGVNIDGVILKDNTATANKFVASSPSLLAGVKPKISISGYDIPWIDIWNAFSEILPNIGDKVLISGGYQQFLNVEPTVFSYAHRYSTTNISLVGYRNGPHSFVVTSSNTTSVVYAITVAC